MTGRFLTSEEKSNRSGPNLNHTKSLIASAFISALSLHISIVSKLHVGGVRVHSSCLKQTPCGRNENLGYSCFLFFLYSDRTPASARGSRYRFTLQPVHIVLHLPSGSFLSIAVILFLSINSMNVLSCWEQTIGTDGLNPVVLIIRLRTVWGCAETKIDLQQCWLQEDWLVLSTVKISF